MKKIILFIAALFAGSAASAFTQVRQVQISTGSLSRQSGAFNVQSGSMTNLTATNVTSSGTYTASGSTFALTNAVTTGNMLDHSTTTKEGQILAADGIAGAPKYSFKNDTNTGIYRVGNGIIGLATAGVLKWRVESNGEIYSPNGNVFWGSDGTQAAPGYSFFNDTDCGIWRSGANDWFLVSNGTTTLESSTNGINTYLANADSNSNGVSQLTVTNPNAGSTASSVLTFNSGGTRRGRIYTDPNSTAGVMILQTRNSDGVTFSTGVVISTTGATAVKGTNTSDSAGSGYYGEFITSAAASGGVLLTTGRYTDSISTFTLTAGDWEIWANGIFLANGATFSAGPQTELCIGTAPGDATTGCLDGQNYIYNNAATSTAFAVVSMAIAPYRVSISGNTNYYLKTYIATVSVGAAKFRGSMSARRMR